MPGRLCLLQNPCWESWSDAKPAAAPCVLWDRGEQPGPPSPDQGIFWVPGLLLPPPHAKGVPWEPRHPWIQGNAPFLGSAWGPRRRRGAGEASVAGGCETISCLFSLSSGSADSAPQMSLSPCPCPLSPHSFRLKPSPPRTSRPGIPAAGKGRSPGSLMAFNPWS